MQSEGSDDRDCSCLPVPQIARYTPLVVTLHRLQGQRTHARQDVQDLPRHARKLADDASFWQTGQMAPMVTALGMDGAVARLSRVAAARQPFRAHRPCHRPTPGRRQELVIRAAEADRSRSH